MAEPNNLSAFANRAKLGSEFTDAATVAKRDLKRDWNPDPDSFRRFLAWLDEGNDSGGERYLEMRRRLVAYFDRKECADADELADETLNRVARRLDEEGRIDSESPARYCYIVAKFVFLESLRRKGSVSLDDVMHTESIEPAAVSADEDAEHRELMLECLERCIAKLETVSREIISGYYFGEERIKIDNRRAIAGRLGISANALTIRACRIRDKLEDCVRKCAGNRGKP